MTSSWQKALTKILSLSSVFFFNSNSLAWLARAADLELIPGGLSLAPVPPALPALNVLYEVLQALNVLYEIPAS